MYIIQLSACPESPHASILCHIIAIHIYDCI